MDKLVLFNQLKSPQGISNNVLHLIKSSNKGSSFLIVSVCFKTDYVPENDSLLLQIFPL